jgi:two-component system sensor histidine kinase AlgZ
MIPAALIATLLVSSSQAPWSLALALAVPMAIAMALLCLASWYICRSTPLRTTEVRRLIVTHGAAGAATSALWLAMAHGWSGAVPEAWPGIAPAVVIALQAPALFAVGVLLYLVGASGHYLYLAVEESRLAESRALDLKLQAREAELRALRAQIDPHFLFNSLNSISGLVSSDAAAARSMCVLLADFLRASLRLGGRETVPLEEEVRLATGYLAVERIRFGPRLAVEASIDDAALRCLVPPLILQPLVENAVTHGIAHLIDGGAVRLEARLDRGDLVVSLTNPVDPDRPASRGEGLGLDNARRRLATIYGGAARLGVRREASRFEVEVTLPAVREG